LSGVVAANVVKADNQFDRAELVAVYEPTTEPG